MTRLRLVLALSLAVALALSGCPRQRGDDDTEDDDDSATVDDDDQAQDDDDGAPDDDDAAPDDDDSATDDDDAVPGDQRAAGMVLDPDGGLLRGVEVGGQATTGPDGWFELLVASGEQVISFGGEGLAPSWQRIELPGGVDQGLQQRLRAAGEAVEFQVLDGVDTGVVQVGAEAVDSADSVSIVVTEYLESDLGTLPVGREPLRFFGALRIDLTDATGQAVGLVPGRFFQIDLAALDPDDELLIAQELAAFRFDPSTAAWVDGGAGQVYAAPDGSPVWLYHAASPGLWAAGVRPASGCYTGRVVDADGDPRQAAWLGAAGDRSFGLAATGPDGVFVLGVAAGMEHTLDVLWIDGEERGYLPDVAASSAPEGAECLDLGDLAAASESCVSGIVLDESNLPLEGVLVRSSTGEQATTSVSGSYCMAAPVLTQVSMYGPLVPGGPGLMPWSVLTEPGSPVCAGGCPNIAVLRPYFASTCVTGTLQVDGAPQTGVSVELFDDAAPALPIAEISPETGSAGEFCMEAPGGASLTVTVTDDGVVCAPLTASTVGLSTGSCPAGCLDLGVLDCSSVP